MGLIDDYLSRTRDSAALFQRATQSIPGGSTRTTIFNPPYPLYMARGEGLRTWDVDGFHLAPRGMGAISTPATEADIDDLADAIVARLAAMQPAAVAVS